MNLDTEPYVVAVAYPAELYFESNLDEQIEEAAGVPCDGSGMGFGERDLSFSFPTMSLAQQAAVRIKELGQGVSASVFDSSKE
jgi:hypothetical protein